MEWYVPLTILPAVGLLILSTSNFIISLNNEIIEMEKLDDINELLITLKLDQLKRLGVANACLYGTATLFLISGLIKALTGIQILFNYLMIGGAFSMTIALLFLFIHSLKAVSIRHRRLSLK